MTRVCTRLFVAAAAVVLFGGCQVKKSANPLSPAVAGPVEGVVISHPNLLEPGQDWELKTRDQPVQLLIQNADTNGARPLKYTFEIASDAEFKNIIFTRTGVEPGGDGLTRLQLPDKLAAGTYWWRTRAEDGANTGPYSPVKSFQVLAQVILAPPTPSAPSNGSTDHRVSFLNSGSGRAIEAASRRISNTSSRSRTTHRSRRSRPPSRRRRRGPRRGSRRTIRSSTAGPTTGACAPGIRPTAPTSATGRASTRSGRLRLPSLSLRRRWIRRQAEGGGGGGTGGGAACNSNDGDDIAACIEARYPQYLAAGVSLSRRTSNMQFLRDRMIEHGKCRGLNLGLNLKRGGPSISNDFIVWRRSGQHDMGVDIARGYDDTDSKLRLMWHTLQRVRELRASVLQGLRVGKL